MFKRKKAVLLIHGFVGGIYDFGQLPNEIEINKNLDVFIYTLKEHDKMIINDIKYNEWIDEAINQIEFLIKNNYKEIYIIGHSMGGVIATHLASIYKEVKKLVLVAPAYRYFCFENGKINIKGINNTLKEMPEVFKNMGVEKVLERIVKTPIQTMIEFTKLVNEYQEDIKKITCPILTIHGTDDKVVPSESTDYVYNSVLSKSNTLVNINEVTHDCFTQKRKEEINKIIINFLKEKNKNKKVTLNI